MAREAGSLEEMEAGAAGGWEVVGCRVVARVARGVAREVARGVGMGTGCRAVGRGVPQEGREVAAWGAAAVAGSEVG